MNDSKKISLPSVQIPTLECDVLVAGAGTAGCIAAIAAARQGVSVILVEKTASISSSSTRSWLPSGMKCSILWMRHRGQ